MIYIFLRFYLYNYFITLLFPIIFSIIGLILIIEDAGIVSPSKKPQGFKDSTLSKISLRIPVIEIAKNIPGIPHNIPKAKTAVIEKTNPTTISVCFA